MFIATLIRCCYFFLDMLRKHPILADFHTNK